MTIQDPKDPRPTDDLSDVAAWPFCDGADEIVIRVSRYGDDLDNPACFQALVKGRDKHRVWGVGMKANPVAALKDAIAEFYARADVGWPDGGEHGHKREPLIQKPEDPEDPDLEDMLS